MRAVLFGRTWITSLALHPASAATLPRNRLGIRGRRAAPIPVGWARGVRLRTKRSLLVLFRCRRQFGAPRESARGFYLRRGLEVRAQATTRDRRMVLSLPGEYPCLGEVKRPSFHDVDPCFRSK